MEYQTRDLGVVDVRPDQIFEFAAPVLGFESYRKFAILPDFSAEPFHWLQSLEDPGLAFPVVNANEFQVAFDGNEDALTTVSASSWDEVDCWIICVVPQDGSQMRVNLRAPVIANKTTGVAGQVVLRDEYPVSCKMLEFAN